MVTSTDRIEKRVHLKASQERVWRALSDSQEFGRWFGAEIDGAFSPGAQLNGRIVPTHIAGPVADVQEKYRGLPIQFFVEHVHPMSHLSFRWHPFAIDQNVDYSTEPMTLVEFVLAEERGGTLLTIVESGFDALPIERRADAFEADEEGWGMIADLVAQHLQLHP